MVKRIAIIGGSGFLGKYIATEALKQGYLISIISRMPERAESIKTDGFAGQAQFISANIRDINSVSKAIKNADIVINLVGILYEKGKQTFETVHKNFPTELAKVCKEQNKDLLIHLSALGIDKSSLKSSYAKSKLAGEDGIKDSFSKFIIFRPSVIFGPEDNFFNQFAWLAKFSPILPLFGFGKTKFQPVYVDDVANCIIASINNKNAVSKTFELGGPEVFSFKELLKLVLEFVERKRILLPIPLFIAKIKGAVLSLLPVPPFTKDQMKLLEFNNVVLDNKNNFSFFNIQPKSVYEIVPKYLKLYQPKD
jgi:NADH dehydrogenase